MLGNMPDTSNRKAQILQTAATLFRERGYQAASMRDIATAMHIRYVTTREIRADKISICDLRKLNGGPRISRRIDFSPSDLLSENEMKPLLSRYAETIDALVAEGHNVSFRKPKPNQQADIFGD